MPAGVKVQWNIGKHADDDRDEDDGDEDDGCGGDEKTHVKLSNPMSHWLLDTVSNVHLVTFLFLSRPHSVDVLNSKPCQYTLKYKDFLSAAEKHSLCQKWSGQLESKSEFLACLQPQPI